MAASARTRGGPAAMLAVAVVVAAHAVLTASPTAEAAFAFTTTAPAAPPSIARRRARSSRPSRCEDVCVGRSAPQFRPRGPRCDLDRARAVRSHSRRREDEDAEAAAAAAEAEAAEPTTTSASSAATTSTTRERIRSVRGKVKSFARSLVPKRTPAALLSADAVSDAARNAARNVVPDPRAVAETIKDAAFGTAELAVEEVIVPAVEEFNRELGAKIHFGRAFGGSESTTTSFGPGIVADTSRVERSARAEGQAARAIDAVALAKTAASDAFAAAEDAISEAEGALAEARRALTEAKAEAAEAIAAAEGAAAASLAAAGAAEAAALAEAARGEAAEAAAEATATATAVAAPAAEEKAEAAAEATATEEAEAEAEAEAGADVSALAYEDVGYHLSEMAPPFLGEDQCLVPGEAVVRVEKAPDNSRRIFAGIDIMASVDDVWKVLTDYERLQEVVPNLVVNEVMELYESDASAPSNVYDPAKPDEEQCREISTHMRGAKLRQVGGAKVVGINFSARTTLEVREWPQGMPDFAHYADEVYEGKSRDRRAREGKGLKLKRYRFPRPFALSSLPTRDISMQSVSDDDGEFRMYQGVWRMQPLPGCSPPGLDAMRLTYAVEISPRPYLPVALVEGRIAQDLCTNLRAIRDHVSPDGR